MKCILCGNDIKYKRKINKLSVVINGIEIFDNSKHLIHGYAHSICEKNLINKISIMLEKNIKGAITSGETIQ